MTEDLEISDASTVIREIAIAREESSSSAEDDESLTPLPVDYTLPIQRIVTILTRTTINMFLPFINGMCLGFGEIFAHELGFRWGWTGAKVSTEGTFGDLRIDFELTAKGL